jgi:hypothetical protein
MKHLVQFELADGSPVYAEVDEPESTQRRVSLGSDGIEKAQERFVEAIRKVQPAAAAALQTFRELDMPNEITLEFAIKLNGTLGAVFATVNSEANFKVSLKWTKRS